MRPATSLLSLINGHSSAHSRARLTGLASQPDTPVRSSAAARLYVRAAIFAPRSCSVRLRSAVISFWQGFDESREGGFGIRADIQIQIGHNARSPECCSCGTDRPKRCDRLRAARPVGPRRVRYAYFEAKVTSGLVPRAAVPRKRMAIRELHALIAVHGSLQVSASSISSFVRRECVRFVRK